MFVSLQIVPSLTAIDPTLWPCKSFVTIASAERAPSLLLHGAQQRFHFILFEHFLSIYGFFLCFHFTFSCKSSVSSFYLWFVPPLHYCLLLKTFTMLPKFDIASDIWYQWLIYIFTSVVVVMWQSVFISPFICEQNNLKIYEVLGMKISGNVDNGPRKRWFNFITWIIKQSTLALHPYCLDIPTTGVQA